MDAGSDQDPSSGDQGSRWRQAWNNPAYRFAALFLAFLGIGAVGYPVVSRRYFFLIEAANSATAHVVYTILRPFADETVVSAYVLTYGSFAVSIIEECTGIYEMIIFTAAVLAFPTRWAKKGIGIALGIPMLYAFNILRILVLMITSVWLAWIFWVVRRDTETVVPSD